MRRCVFEVVQAWCDWLEARGTSPRTIDAYWRALLACGKRAGKDPRDFLEPDVVEVLSQYPLKGAGRGMAIRAMRSFFTWAEDGEMLINPAKRIPIPRPKSGPAPRLSREELERVWEAAEKIDPRAGPTLRLLYFTGARVGSMVGVLPEHIRFDRQGRPSVYFAVAKGDYPYEVPIEAPEAVAALCRLLELREWNIDVGILGQVARHRVPEQMREGVDPGLPPRLRDPLPQRPPPPLRPRSDGGPRPSSASGRSAARGVIVE